MLWADFDPHPACQGNGHGGEDHAVNGGCVRQNGLDKSQVNAESDWTGALPSPHFSKLDEPLTIELWDSQRPQPVLKEGETRRLRSSDAFPDVLKVLAMQLNQITERFRLTRASYQSGFAAIDTPLDIECPFLGVLAAEERFVDILSFPPHLDSPGARFELCESRQNMCAPCALSRRTAAKRVA